MIKVSPMNSAHVGVADAVPSLSAPRLMLLFVLGLGIVSGLRASHFDAPTFHRAITQSAPAIVPVAMKTAQKKISVLPVSSAFAQEMTMKPSALIQRWQPIIAAASRQFHISPDWVRSVMRMESGGRTMLDERYPITSDAGAMGLMQVMPQTYRDMRAAYKLGADPYNPHDNIYAGVAYLSALHKKYGYPAMFAAYNDGPGNLEAHLFRGRPLPDETIAYMSGIVGGAGAHGAGKVKMTQPDGAPVTIDLAQVRGVRAPLPGEYAENVQAVITVGKKHQGVREDLATAKRLTLS
jgi:hypothetical protein